MNKQIQVVNPKLQTLYGLPAIDFSNQTVQVAASAVAGVTVGVVLYFVIKKIKARKA